MSACYVCERTHFAEGRRWWAGTMYRFREPLPASRAWQFREVADVVTEPPRGRRPFTKRGVQKAMAEATKRLLVLEPTLDAEEIRLNLPFDVPRERVEEVLARADIAAMRRPIPEAKRPTAWRIDVHEDGRSRTYVTKPLFAVGSRICTDVPSDVRTRFNKDAPRAFNCISHPPKRRRRFSLFEEQP